MRQRVFVPLAIIGMLMGTAARSHFEVVLPAQADSLIESILQRLAIE